MSAGEADVFLRNQGSLDNWGFVTSLNSPDANLLGQFGFAVDVSGDFVIVGDWIDNFTYAHLRDGQISLETFDG